MAAVAAAWALAVDWDKVRAALQTFITDAVSAPGRFNQFSWRGATLIADYGHNPDAIVALVQAVESMPAKRRGGGHQRRRRPPRPGYQRPDRASSAMLSTMSILYQDQCQRGRADGEVIALLREGLKDAPRASHIEEITGEFVAIDRALECLQAGDLCLILVDQVEEALTHIVARIAGGAGMQRVMQALPAPLSDELSRQLERDEQVLAILETDLDIRLQFRSGLLILTDRRLLSRAPETGAWKAWGIRQGRVSFSP